MKPTFLSAEGFKGRDFEYNLKSVNCWSAPNDGGKTAVLDACRVALLGYHPSLGKQSEMTAKLMSDNRLDMAVNLHFDGGQTISRTWKRNAKGEIKKSEQSDIDEVPPVMLDLRQYLGQTKKERIASITSKFKVEGQLSDEKIMDLFMKLEVLPANECQPSVVDLLMVFGKSVKRRTNTKQSIPEWLPQLVKDLEDERKAFAIKQDLASSQMIGLRPADSKPPKSVADQIEKATKEMAEVTKALTEIELQQKLIAQSSRLRTELQAIIDRPIEDVNDKVELSVKLEKELKDYKPELPGIQKQIADSLREFKATEAAIANGESRILFLRDKIAEMEKLTACPTCGSQGTEWLANIKKGFETEIKTTEKALLTLHAQQTQVIKTGKELRKKEETAKLNDAGATENSRTIQTLNSDIKIASIAITARNSAIAELGHMSQIVGATDPAEFERLHAKQMELTAQLMVLNDSENAFKSYQSNREQSLKLERESIGYQARIEVFKKAAALIIAEQESLVAKAFGFVLEHARKFTDGILPGTLDYRDGEIGMVTEAGWVAHEVMATASQTLAYIGIATALAQQSPTKIVLLDEAGIIDSTRKPKVVQRLLDLCKDGTIDAVLMADPSKVGYEGFVSTFDRNGLMITWGDPDFQLVEIV